MGYGQAAHRELSSCLRKWNETRNRRGNGEKKIKSLQGEKSETEKTKKIKYLIVFTAMATFTEHLFHPKGKIHIC